MASLRSWIRGHQVLVFFGLTYLISWAILFPGVTLSAEVVALLFILAGFGPLLAAVIVTVVSGGDLHVWASQILRWRVGLRWYAAALVVLPAIFLVIQTGCYAALGVPLRNSITPTSGLGYFTSVLTVMLIGGGQEELGWRGFALPRLEDRYTAGTASLVIGVVWAGWHLPLALLPNASLPGGAGAGLLTFAVGVIGASVILTYMYNSTGASVLLAMVLHGAINSYDTLLPLSRAGISRLDPVLFGLINQLPLVLVAVGLLVVYGWGEVSNASIPSPAAAGAIGAHREQD